MRKFLIIFMCLIFAGLVTSTSILAVKYSAEINKTEKTQPTDTSGLVNTIEELQKLVKDLTAEKSTLQVKADNLTAKNESLQAQIKALQSQVDVDADTIQDLQRQLTDNEALIDDLNSQISNLEASIRYYEGYIQGFENENQVTATFIEEDKVIATPIFVKGARVTAPEIFSNEYRVFVGWTVNGELVDLFGYTIEEDTTFVAKFDYYSYAIFICYETDFNEEYQIPRGESIASVIPEDPVLDGYRFKGWFYLIQNEDGSDGLGDAISSDLIPEFYVIIIGAFEEIPTNGTYKLVLWHSTLTVQAEVTLFGNTVSHTFSDDSITSSSNGLIFLLDSNINLTFDGSILTINLLCTNFGSINGCRIKVVYVYNEELDKFEETTKSIITTISLNTTDITSGTTITFREGTTTTTKVTGDFSFKYSYGSNDFFLVKVYIVDNEVMGSAYEVLNSNSSYNENSFSVEFLDSDTLYISFGTTYKDGSSYVWTSQFKYSNLTFNTEYAKFNNSTATVTITTI